MFPTPTERTAAVTADFEAGAVVFAGPAAAEAEVAGLVLAAFAGVLGLTSTAIEVLAVLGVLVWVVALLVLVAVDVSRAAHRRNMHEHGRKRLRRLTQDHWRGWR